MYTIQFLFKYLHAGDMPILLGITVIHVNFLNIFDNLINLFMFRKNTKWKAGTFYRYQDLTAIVSHFITKNPRPTWQDQIIP
jgi:hypothetical protein